MADIVRSKNFFRLFLLSLFLGYLSIESHEFGHWLVLQIYSRDPLMGFGGLVQMWNRVPNDPDEWVNIHYPGVGDGWLHLGSLPESDFEWAVMLFTGEFMQLLLILVGIFLAKKGRFKEIGSMLALFNSLRFIPGIVGYLMGSKGDAYFIAYHTGVPEILIRLIFISVEFFGFVWIFRHLRDRHLWFGAILLSYPFFRALMFIDFKIVRQQVDYGSPLFVSVLGWSLPVFIMNILIVVVLIYFALKSLYLTNTRR